MTTSLELAQNLEAARRASGLTRKALTEQAGVSRQAVYRLMRGDDVQVSTLLAVMDVLGLDVAAVPRRLQRGLPEFSAAQAAMPVADSSARSASLAARSAAPMTPMAPTAPTTHVQSAVQQRLAGLRRRATASKGGE